MKISKQEYVEKYAVCDCCGVQVGIGVDSYGEAVCLNCGETMEGQVKYLEETWERMHEKWEKED
jgi:transcription initiation factor TFIIIB Brf1 subunit/transcription initiation factor TFIIB